MQTHDERASDNDHVTDGATSQYTAAQSVETRGGRGGSGDEELRDREVQTSRTSADSHSTMALPHKKSARGMSMRRRIGLKIEPDTSGGTTKKHSEDPKDSEKESQLRPQGLTDEADSTGGDAGGDGGGEKEWWKREYRAPRPGHLGAHVIAREEEHSSPARGRNTSTSSDPSGNATPPTPSRTVPLSSSLTSTPSGERPHLHETPERARRVRGGNELYDAVTSHSSPNPKRKIMALQDVEAGSFPSMGVAKELKRFHETNGALQQQHVEGESELARTLRTAVVTPSKLLRSMKKIDLEAGSAPATTTLASDQQPSETKASKAAPTESA